MTSAGAPTDGPSPDLTRFPHSTFGETLRQTVLDAAAVLQVRRGELAARLARGPLPTAEVLGTSTAVDQWLVDRRSDWRELLLVEPSATAAQLRTSLPRHRQVVTAGARMVSLYDHDGVDEGGRLLLAAETLGSHKLAICPVRMRILNRRSVLLPGPDVGGEPSVMQVTAGPCIEAAWAYWEAALGSAVPTDTADVIGDLTARQRLIMSLLASDLGDDAIAAALEVSVRTVRSDIAAVMDKMGVRSRFAAGHRLRVWEATRG